MANITVKIALPIILTGLFIITVFVALDYSRLDANFYIVFLIVIFYVFFFGFAVGQNFVSPVKKILQKAGDLIRGDLSSRVYLGSKDELGDLAKVFNKIADKLEENKAIIETIEKGVDIKVKARTEALEETINALEQKVKNRTIELERLIEEASSLHTNIKNKETEAVQLKEELACLSQKLSKHSKPKKEVKEAVEPVNNNI